MTANRLDRQLFPAIIQTAVNYNTAGFLRDLGGEAFSEPDLHDFTIPVTHPLLSRADDPGSEPFLHIHNLITSQPANKERRQQIAKEAGVLHSSYGLFEEEDGAVLLAFFYGTAPIAFLWTLDFIQGCQKFPDSKVHTAVQPFTHSLAKAHCHFAPIRNRPQVRGSTRTRHRHGLLPRGARRRSRNYSWARWVRARALASRMTCSSCM